MRKSLIGRALVRGWLVGGLLVALAANAQEGFPLDGTWRGVGTAADGSHSTVVLIILWDGKQVTGTINPGPQGIDFSEGVLDPDGWKVRIAAKDAKGTPISLEGSISDLGKYNRVINGKWTEGGNSRDIRFVRE